MSQINTIERLAQSAAEAFGAPQMTGSAHGTVTSFAAAQGVTLRRTGKRPLYFEGQELCMAMSFVVGTPFWYELNIYRTAAQSFVVNIRLFMKSENESDVHRAVECATFDDVMQLLETYEPADDVRVDVNADDDSLSLAELVVKTLSLRARIEEARRQFKSLVGQVLYELDQ